MAEYTEKYKLKKPAQEDNYDVEDFNENAEIIEAALGAVASLDSPVFTGTPTAPTPVLGDSTTKIATTAFVKQQFVFGRYTGNGNYANPRTINLGFNPRYLLINPSQNVTGGNGVQFVGLRHGDSFHYHSFNVSNLEVAFVENGFQIQYVMFNGQKEYSYMAIR